MKPGYVVSQNFDTPKATRFELIDHTDKITGPSRYTRLGVSVRIVLQDDGRTCKVFLSDSPIATPVEVAQQMSDGMPSLAGWEAAQ